MNRFKNILFVADGTAGEKVALSKTMEFAKLNKAKLTVIDTVNDYTNSLLSRAFKRAIAANRSEIINQRTAELKKLVASAKPRNSRIKSEIIVISGKDFIEIIKSAMKNKNDLIVKVASGDSRLTGMLFGSLDLHLMRKCPCPVWIIKPAKKISHSRILATVDLEPAEKGALNLNHFIMDLASSLSEIEKGELHVLHAWFLPDEARLKDKRVAIYKSVASLLKELRAVQKRHLAELLSNYASFEPQSHLIKGQPDKVIPRFVKNHGIDLLVMGTLARSGIAGFFIGNTAEKILNSVNCSVLAVKPEGFKSPIKA